MIMTSFDEIERTFFRDVIRVQSEKPRKEENRENNEHLVPRTELQLVISGRQYTSLIPCLTIETLLACS